jgi:hypothetical protein
MVRYHDAASARHSLLHFQPNTYRSKWAQGGDTKARGGQEGFCTALRYVPVVGTIQRARRRNDTLPYCSSITYGEKGGRHLSKRAREGGVGVAISPEIVNTGITA